jgi:ornithine--oxo-acid transaminase
MNSQELMAIEDQYGARNYRPLDVVVDRGEGVWLYDTEGRRYLDCLSAYSAVNQGHCHPRIVKVMREQAGRLTLTSRAFRNSQLGLFEQDLCELGGYEMALPMNTGSEAVETALKAARRWGYQVKGVPADQAEIIACVGNFHGRTISIISMSSEVKYTQGFGPLTPGFRLVPFGDAEALEACITDNTVAFLVEPIQGEGGVIIPPDGYLRAAAALCERYHILFMVDEIQTGLGRAGHLFAHQAEGVRPDVVMVGKALSGGLYPVSAVLADRPVLGLFGPGDHGSTFGGNPLAAAVAREALRVLVDERLSDRSMEMGSYFLGRLARLESSLVREVRGRGLMIGVELQDHAGGGRRYCEALAGRGLLCKETRGNVIRLTPPLVITRNEIDWAVEQVAAVLEA